jgi:hypothetical protein
MASGKSLSRRSSQSDTGSARGREDTTDKASVRSAESGVVRTIEDDFGRPEKPLFSPIEQLQTLFGTLISYGAIASDLWAGQNYYRNADTWYLRVTLFLAFVPGVAMCVVQHFTFYREPSPLLGDMSAPIDTPVSERPPTFVPRKGGGMWLLYYIVNLLQLRTLLECGLSFAWGFQTEAWRDIRTLQATLESFPQAMLQAYIMFRKWDTQDVGFSFVPTIVCLSFALATICFAPSRTSCFEERPRFRRVQQD